MTHASDWLRQDKALRDPRQLWTCTEQSAGLVRRSLAFTADPAFIELLSSLSITLFISREYENLLISLKSDGNRLFQNYLAMPHPSGIACDRKKNLMYIASTRNPNIIYQLRQAGEGDPRRPRHSILKEKPMLVARKKYYPGLYYFHDLAIMSGKLYANAVGMNGIIRVNLEKPEPDELAWYPKCIEDSNGNPRTEANYIQLNSIAGGDSPRDSFYSASGDKIGYDRPGHLRYKVDKRGVIFSGKTRETCAVGLTRPHSLRMHKGTLWLANSGYGEFGYLKKGSFESVVKLDGWTRGVLLIKDIAFVGTSKIIPRYRHYAPGLKDTKDSCGLYAISISSGSILGTLTWPAGNQIFAIDYLKDQSTSGFQHSSFAEKTKSHSKLAFNN